MANDKPLVYFILGAAGSGRRAVLLDLVTGGLPPEAKPAVLVSDAESPSEADAKLPGFAQWTWEEDNTVDAAPLTDVTHIFLVTDGRVNPVDQIEAGKVWLTQIGGEIGRIITVVNCRLAEANPPLRAWYDACVNFSDVVLLNQRDGVANKWLSDFQKHYKEQFLPCLFEFVKNDRVKNPAEILAPEARRIAHLFDEELNWIVTGGDDEEEAEGDEEVEAAPEEDHFLLRHAGGRRVHEIPDITKFLP
jgi:hypothetical protein